jgi:hypothetical protein
MTQVNARVVSERAQRRFYAWFRKQRDLDYRVDQREGWQGPSVQEAFEAAYAMGFADSIALSSKVGQIVPLLREFTALLASAEDEVKPIEM